MAEPLLKLHNLSESPPGYFRFLVRETGVYFKGYCALSDLINDLRKHYTANHIPVPEKLEALVQDQLCRDLPPECCGRNSGQGSSPLTVEQVVTGTRTLISWQIQGRPKVDVGEANRRAAVCVQCDQNMPIRDCPTCNNPLNNMVNAFVGTQKTMHDSRLHSCKVCGCSLKAKVLLPLDILKGNMPESMQEKLPSWCWLKG